MKRKLRKFVACAIFQLGCFCEQMAFIRKPQALLMLKCLQLIEYEKLKKSFDNPA